jgi:hypothetical protein
MFASRASNYQQAPEPDPSHRKDQARTRGFDGYLRTGDHHDPSVADASGPKQHLSVPKDHRPIATRIASGKLELVDLPGLGSEGAWSQNPVDAVPHLAPLYVKDLAGGFGCFGVFLTGVAGCSVGFAGPGSG